VGKLHKLKNKFRISENSSHTSWVKWVKIVKAYIFFAGKWEWAKYRYEYKVQESKRSWISRHAMTSCTSSMMTRTGGGWPQAVGGIYHTTSS
jgi:hypothetical protein